MSYLSDFEHTKLDAQVFPGCVVQKHYISSAISGKRRVPITKEWRVEKLLGKGTFGEVRLEAYSDNRNRREQRAVKRIWTSGTEFKKSYERELKALLEFSKPKYKESAVFVEFLGWFEDLESVYLAMEYLPLGDLEDNALAVGGSIKEEEVREIAMQVLEGLRIMHLENFAHRDLKPKNVLVCQGPPNWWVKLADFGLSKRRTDETGFRTQTGTFAYMAPEILNYIPEVDAETSEYTNAVDMWALGCIVYRLICGAVPFPPGPSLVKFCVVESEFPMKIEELTGLGQSFVKGLIVPYPSRRLTAQQALDHPWTRSGLEASNTESRSISFSGYDTVTHPGLQSHEPNDASPVLDPNDDERPLPKGYHAPTVEDQEEETLSDNQSFSDDAEEPDSTMWPPPAKSKRPKTSEEIPIRISPQQSGDPYMNIVEQPVPPPTPPSRKKPSRSRTQSRAPYIVEPNAPPPSVPKKPSLQIYSSAPPDSSLPQEQLTRLKIQDYPRNEDISRLPRAQKFTRDQAPNLPRAQTFQAGDRRESRLRREYTSSESDSDTPVYTNLTRGMRRPVRYHVETPERPKNPEPTRYIVENGRSVLVSRHRADLHGLDEKPSSSRPKSSRNSSTRSRESRSPPVRSREENFAKEAAAYQEGIGSLTVPLTLENLQKLENLHPSSPPGSEDDGESFHRCGFYKPPNGKQVAGFWDDGSIRPSEAPSAVATAEEPTYYADENGFNDNPFAPGTDLYRELAKQQIWWWRGHVARSIAVESEPVSHPAPASLKPSRRRRHKNEPIILTYARPKMPVRSAVEAFALPPDPREETHSERRKIYDNWGAPRQHRRHVDHGEEAPSERRNIYNAGEAPRQHSRHTHSGSLDLPISAPNSHYFPPTYLSPRYPANTSSDSYTDGW